MSYYHGLISSKKAESILSKVTTEGCFLIRDSQSQPGNFVLSVKYSNHRAGPIFFHIYIYCRYKRQSISCTDIPRGERERVNYTYTILYNSLDIIILIVVRVLKDSLILRNWYYLGYLMSYV